MESPALGVRLDRSRSESRGNRARAEPYSVAAEQNVASGAGDPAAGTGVRPIGWCRYFCVPHEAAGMTGTVVVERSEE